MKSYSMAPFPRSLAIVMTASEAEPLELDQSSVR